VIANETHFAVKECKCRKTLKLLLHIEISNFDNESKLQKTPKRERREEKKFPKNSSLSFFCHLRDAIMMMMMICNFLTSHVLFEL